MMLIAMSVACLLAGIVFIGAAFSPGTNIKANGRPWYPWHAIIKIVALTVGLLVPWTAFAIVTGDAL